MNIPFIDKFPVDVLILQKRGQSVLWKKDQARYMTKRGVAYYELKRGKTKFRPGSFKDMVPTTKGRQAMILYEYARNMFVPVDTSHIEIEFEVDDQGELVLETPKFECEEGHQFEEPTTVTVKNKVTRKEKELIACPICKSTKLADIPESERGKAPKMKKAINLTAIDEDMAYWGQMRRWEAENRHKETNWWKENVHFIMFAMTWILLIVLSYIFMGAISETGHSVTNALIKAAETYASGGGPPPG